MMAEELLSEMDQTLDQLIINAKAIEQASYVRFDDYETELMHKTQQSLLARFIFLEKESNKESFNQAKETAKELVYKKLQAYDTLHGKFMKRASQSLRSPARRRSKKS
jgi:hypothetical protein